MLFIPEKNSCISYILLASLKNVPLHVALRKKIYVTLDIILLAVPKKFNSRKLFQNVLYRLLSIQTKCLILFKLFK